MKRSIYADARKYGMLNMKKEKKQNGGEKREMGLR